MQVIERKHLKSFIAKDGSEIREFYHSENMSFADAVVNAGKTTKLHYHETSEEIYFILEGKGLMEIEGEESEVSKGQAIVIPPMQRHRIRNTGNQELMFLCICSPPYSDDDTVLE